MLEDKVLDRLMSEVSKANFDVNWELSECESLETQLREMRDDLISMPKRWVRKIATLKLEYDLKWIELERCRKEYNEALDRLEIAQEALDDYRTLTPIEQTKANLCRQLMVLNEIKEDYNQYNELSDTAQHEISCLEQDIANIKIQIERLSKIIRFLPKEELRRIGNGRRVMISRDNQYVLTTANVYTQEGNLICENYFNGFITCHTAYMTGIVKLNPYDRELNYISI